MQARQMPKDYAAMSERLRFIEGRQRMPPMPPMQRRKAKGGAKEAQMPARQMYQARMYERLRSHQ